MRLNEIRNLLREPGAEIKITVEQDSVAKKIVLTLSNEPDPFAAKSSYELIETTADFDN